ncbi:hypothetical protein [Phenylobacterium ferrooxidans]|uniref:Uncharacterized protein n=1 Tax=Phenylobacterium ferrooxidans TaxID=2982689 RepID=A0ABW6CLV0_9CAUL
MRFSPTNLNAHIVNMGQDLGWRRASACPCFSPASGNARFDCLLCGGRGHTWAAEVVVRAGLSSQTSKKALAQFGVYEIGDALLTIGSDSPLYDMGQYDRVRGLTSTNRFSTMMTRGQGDTLLGTIKSVDRVFWLNEAANATVEGGIPTVSDAGVLTWATGEPPAGTQYVVNGVRFDEFFAFLDLPSDRNIGGANLPRKVPVRKFDLLGR